jgi:hypothetical protein
MGNKTERNTIHVCTITGNGQFPYGDGGLLSYIVVYYTQAEFCVSIIERLDNLVEITSASGY